MRAFAMNDFEPQQDEISDFDSFALVSLNSEVAERLNDYSIAGAPPKNAGVDAAQVKAKAASWRNCRPSSMH
jgi:hypothetical protein